MRFKDLAKAAALAAILALSACVTAPEITKTADNNYVITRVDKGGSLSDVASTRQSIIADANKFADGQGKVAVKVSMKDTPMQIQGYTSIEYKFQLMSKAEADAQAAVSAPVAGGAVVVQQSAPMPMYDALLKLDDLHKRGILTDEEFAAQKKKILDRN